MPRVVELVGEEALVGASPPQLAPFGGIQRVAVAQDRSVVSRRLPVRAEAGGLAGRYRPELEDRLDVAGLLGVIGEPAEPSGSSLPLPQRRQDPGVELAPPMIVE